MLSDILKLLARKESLSITQMAQAVGSSVKEIESALAQMEHMGYIRHELFGQGCSSGCTGCGTERGSSEECGFASPETITFWVLTERGQSYIKSNTLGLEK